MGRPVCAWAGQGSAGQGRQESQAGDMSVALSLFTQTSLCSARDNFPIEEQASWLAVVDGQVPAPPPPLPHPAAKCAKLAGDVGAMQAEAARQIEALKEGLARELRKQKASHGNGQRHTLDRHVSKQQHTLDRLVAACWLACVQSGNTQHAPWLHHK